ncbi:hypothetical protein ABIB82_006390 [Bradyrhizobium sp. i1.8.4]
MWTCCENSFDIDGADGIDDALKQVALALRTRAAGDQRAGTIESRGPGSLPRPGRTRHIEQGPDIAETARKRVCLEVEGLTDCQQNAICLVEQVHSVWKNRKAEIDACSVEDRKGRVHRRSERGRGRPDFGALLRRFRLPQSGRRRRHSRQNPNADVRREKRERHATCLRPDRRAKQEVETEDRICWHTANLVANIGRVGRARLKDDPAHPITQVRDIRRVRGLPLRGAAPCHEFEIGGLDFRPHGRIGDHPNMMTMPAQSASRCKQRTEISQRAPRGEEKTVRSHRYPLRSRAIRKSAALVMQAQLEFARASPGRCTRAVQQARDERRVTRMTQTLRASDVRQSYPFHRPSTVRRVFLLTRSTRSVFDQICFDLLERSGATSRREIDRTHRGEAPHALVRRSTDLLKRGVKLERDLPMIH